MGSGVARLYVPDVECQDSSGFSELDCVSAWSPHTEALLVGSLSDLPGSSS